VAQTRLSTQNILAVEVKKMRVLMQLPFPPGESLSSSSLKRRHVNLMLTAMGPSPSVSSDHGFHAPTIISAAGAGMLLGRGRLKPRARTY